ncbi:MAG: glycosyl hydrolase-related protein, partial [Salinibacter sp.]
AHPAWARELPSLPYVESDGEHPRRRGLLRLDNSSVELSAFRPADEDDTRVLRLVNRSDETQEVTATLGFPAEEWCLTDFHETWDDSEARSLTGDQLFLTLDPHQIRTVLLR